MNLESINPRPRLGYGPLILEVSRYYKPGAPRVLLFSVYHDDHPYRFFWFPPRGLNLLPGAIVSGTWAFHGHPGDTLLYLRSASDVRVGQIVDEVFTSPGDPPIPLDGGRPVRARADPPRP